MNISIVDDLSGIARMVRANSGKNFKSLELFQKSKICVLLSLSKDSADLDFLTPAYFYEEAIGENYGSRPRPRCGVLSGGNWNRIWNHQARRV